MGLNPTEEREKAPAEGVALRREVPHEHVREALPLRENRIEEVAVQTRERKLPDEVSPRVVLARAEHAPRAREKAPDEQPERSGGFFRKAGREIVEYGKAFKEAWGHGTWFERTAMVVASVLITFSFLPVYIPLGLVVAYAAPEFAAPYFIFANDQVLLVLGAVIMLMGPKCIRDLTMKHIKNVVAWVKRLGGKKEAPIENGEAR